MQHIVALGLHCLISNFSQIELLADYYNMSVPEHIY
jgi:hypothetical protein